MIRITRTLLPGIISIVIGLSVASPVLGQPVADNVHKQIRAVRVANGGVRLDGVLDDQAWQTAQFVSDFLQKNPDEGRRPTETIRIAIVYDDHAIYVGGRMSCANPDKLRMHLGRYDTQGPAEQLIVAFDTFRDRRTAYAFGVNTSGVRFDRYHPEDNENPKDFSYSPVWKARTARDSAGWTVEMRIPFSQLRFNNQDLQDWGVNFNHWIPERNEDVFWIYTPRDEVGYASRFGDLLGIEGIAPSRRLELLPYGASNARMTQVDDADPFHDDRELDGRLGADLKMGLGPNLTLDATFNPDFGQVEADPAEVNLSAYETQFPEKRPFFTEGGRLFEFDGPQYFYSRRIGQAPHGGVDGDYVDRPASSSILGAAKVTGRLQSGTSIGVLAALTEREYARGYFTDGDSTIKAEVEPATLYGVLRVQQEFGKDESTAGIMLTGLHRDMNADNPLTGEMRKDAFNGGVDWNLRFNGGMYQLDGFAGFSHVSGDTAAIRQTQKSSAHYFQRPDQDHVAIDGRATSMTGLTSSLELEKQSGKHWLWGVGYATESPDFELNDFGMLNAADDIDAWGYAVYRETRPGKIFRSYSTELSSHNGWNYGGFRQYANLNLHARVQWLNYWETSLDYELYTRAQSDNLTRGGPLMKTLLDQVIEGDFGNSHSATTRYGAEIGYAWDDLDGWLYWIDPNFSTRIGNRGAISISPSYARNEEPRQYVTAVDNAGGGEQTYGTRYVFSRIERSQLSLQLRLNYYFSPDLSLEVYAQPFTASGRYFDFGELARPGDNALRFYGTDGTTIARDEDGNYTVADGADTLTIMNLDFGYRSFRSNVVLRWEFLPGSTLYFVWQRNLADRKDPGRLVRPKSLFDSFGVSGEDFVALKISYWIPIS